MNGHEEVNRSTGVARVARPVSRALVFVYGTLLEGERNHGLLAGATRAGAAQTAPVYQLVDVGGFPGMVSGGATAVRGEVYEVDRVTLERLDALEGVPEYYQRVELLLADGRRAQAYVLPEPQAAGCPRIASGDWRGYRAGSSR